MLVKILRSRIDAEKRLMLYKYSDVPWNCTIYQFKLAGQSQDSTGLPQPVSMSAQLATVVRIERLTRDLSSSWTTDFQIPSLPMMKKMRMKVLAPLLSRLSVYLWMQLLVGLRCWWPQEQQSTCYQYHHSMTQSRLHRSVQINRPNDLR